MSEHSILTATDEQLVEQLTQRYLDTLTPDELAYLRKQIRTSPRVREFLIDELATEQAISTHLAPPAAKQMHMMERVAEIAAQRQRRKTRKWQLAVVVGAWAVCILLAFVVQPHGTSTTSIPISSTPSPKDEAPASPGRVNVVAAGNATPTAPAAPRRDPIALTPVDWRVYITPETKGESFTPALFDALFQRVDGFKHNQNDTQRRGLYRLKQPLQENESLRVCLDGSPITLDLWRNMRGIRITSNHADPLIVSRIERRSTRDPKPKTITFLTEARPIHWLQSDRIRSLSISYQQGQLVLADGAQVVVSLPADGAITDTIIDTKHAPIRWATRQPAAQLSLATPARDWQETRPSPKWTVVGNAAIHPIQTGGVHVRVKASDKESGAYLALDSTGCYQVQFELSNVQGTVAVYASQTHPSRITRQYLHKTATGWLIGPSPTLHGHELKQRRFPAAGATTFQWTARRDELELRYRTDQRGWQSLWVVDRHTNAPAEAETRLGVMTPPKQNGAARLTKVKYTQWQSAESAAAVQAAIDDGVPAAKVLASLDGLMACTHKHNAHRRVDETSVARLYTALTQREVLAGRMETLPVIIDAWYNQPFAGRVQREAFPGDAMSAMLLAWLERDQWPMIWTESLRYLYHTNNRTDQRIQTQRRNRASVELARGMAMSAQQYLELPETFVSIYGRSAAEGPLAQSVDRATENAMVDFLSAVRAGEFDQACLSLTTPTLLRDQLVSAGDDPLLLQSSFSIIREALLEHPELQEQLIKQYNAVGEIRVRQVAKLDDVQRLKSLAVQFYGTESGRLAESLLADRELAAGNFLAAADGFASLLANPGAADTQPWLAKFRLSRAMAGMGEGERLTAPVQLGSVRYTPEQFEVFLKSLLTGPEQKPFVPVVADETLAPGPGTMKMKWSQQVNRPAHHGTGPVLGWAGKDMLVCFQSGITILDANNGHRRGEIRYAMHNADPSPAVVPLFDGTKMIARLTNGRDRQLIEADRLGKVRWRNPLGDGPVGAPIAVGRWIYVVSQRPSRRGQSLFVLNQVNPDTGQTVGQHALCERPSVRGGVTISRPVDTGDGLLVQLGGALVRCDYQGQTQWVRRFPQIISTDPSGQGQPLMDRDRVYVISPDGLQLFCVDEKTGVPLWRRAKMRYEQLLSASEYGLCIKGSGFVQQIDRQTGKVIWQVNDLDVALPAMKDQLLVLKKKPDTNNPRRSLVQMRWISLTTGQPTAQHELPYPHDPASRIESVLSDGTHLTLATQRDNTVRVMTLQPE